MNQDQLQNLIDEIGAAKLEQALKKRNSVHSTEIHHIIRDLVMSLLGEKNGKNLEQDELKFSKEAYSQFKQLYLDLYEKRFDELGTN